MNFKEKYTSFFRLIENCKKYIAFYTNILVEKSNFFFKLVSIFLGGEFFNFPVYFSAKTNIFNENISLFVPGSSLRQFCCVPRRGSAENQSCYRDSCAILYFFNHL